MSDNAQWVRPLGSVSEDGWEVLIDHRIEGWTHTGLSVGVFADGVSRTVETGKRECIVVPLAGSVAVSCVDAQGEKHEAELTGRESVFAGPTDVAYLPREAEATVTARGAARVAVTWALASKAQAPQPFRHVAAHEVPVEFRGAGTSSREVRNFGVPGVLHADSLIACEVVTPAGNWSSYPPHKHDQEREGVETELEEIYYFEVRREAGHLAEVSDESPDQGDPIGYQRVYGTADRPIDVLAEVRTGDVVLVPHGWHGPTMATPGYDLYFLNVMAGPGAERAWLICDDPAHGWVRNTWAAHAVDPRLPLGGQ